MAAASIVLAACSGVQPPLNDDRATGELGASPTTVAVTSDAGSASSTDNVDSAVAALELFGRSNQSADPDPETADFEDGSTLTTVEPAPDPPESTVLDSPEEVLEDVGDQLAAADTTPAEADELLDVVEPLDAKPSAGESQDLREGQNINESGEQNVFDEPANLACADVEIAVTALDEGRRSKAAERVGSAAERAASSRVATMDEWHPILRDTAEQISNPRSNEIASLLAFLSTCTQGGYEL